MIWMYYIDGRWWLHLETAFFQLIFSNLFQMFNFLNHSTGIIPRHFHMRRILPPVTFSDSTALALHLPHPTATLLLSTVSASRTPSSLLFRVYTLYTVIAVNQAV